MYYTVYSDDTVFFRRSSTFMMATFGGAFAVEILFDTTTDGAWDSINKGLQWKDIAPKADAE